MKLIKASKEYQNQIVEMLEEWSKYNLEHPLANKSPSKIFKNDYHDFDYYLENLESKEETNGYVKDSVFFLYDEEKDIVIGASNLRHSLNDSLAYGGGHIGDGIRPSLRGKGYGTLLIKLTLEECKKLNINKVMLTANSDNYGSIKTILNNNGIFHSSFINEDNEEENRYWINLDKIDFDLLNKPLTDLEFKKEINRCLNCSNPLCVKACPLNHNIPEFIKLAKENRLEEARNLIEEKSILANICGSICPHQKYCQGHCIKNLKLNPIKIGAIERYIIDHTKVKELQTITLSCKVATIGSGPSSLSYALYLARHGIKVDIYEKSSSIGGLLNTGIPSYRLDKSYLSSLIDELSSLGVTFYLNKEIKDINEIKDKYDSIFVGIGATGATKMNLENDTLEGIMYFNEFLQLTNSSPLSSTHKKNIEGIGQRVLVVGGGNSAIDCARNAIRIEGVENVEILYRRSEEEMPADQEELYQAKLEGIRFNTLINPVKAIGTSHIQFVECAIMELGEKDETGRRKPIESDKPHLRLPVDTLILALGQKVIPPQTLDSNDFNCIKVDENNVTSIENVYAGGDDVNGADSVVNAMKQGLNAAKHFYKKINNIDNNNR